MTEQERADLERRLADQLGDAAWEPATTCPQGHTWDATVEPDGYCPTCVEQDFGSALWIFVSNPDEMRAHQAILAQHPEWLIGRQPKPLARSLDALIPLVEVWCKETGYTWILEHRILSPFVDATIHDITSDGWRGWTKSDENPAEALALALDAALAQEGGRDG